MASRPTLTILIATALALLLASSTAGAHEAGLSTGRYDWADGKLAAKLGFSRGEALRLAPGLDQNGDRQLDAVEAAAAGELARATAAAVGVTLDGKPCASEGARFSLAEEDGLELDASFTCPDGQRGGTLALRAGFLEQLRSGHRHVAALTANGARTTAVLLLDAPEARVAVGPTAPPERRGGLFGPMLLLGVEHILTGFDHLVFLLGLVLVPMSTRLLLGVVTSFTLAHSVSLALAALGVWSPPARLVEPAIAASIVFVGVENLFIEKPDRRVLLTLAFGFVHGFGFAGALAEAQLTRGDVPVALLSFNLGVEAGQLAVLAVALPVLLKLRAHPRAGPTLAREGYAFRASSVFVAALGAAWLVERLV